MKILTYIKNLQNYKIYLQVEDAVNKYLKKQGYLRVDLPVLSPALIPESYLEIFETRFNYLNNQSKLYLTPSPELFLKRLLVEGIGNCYYLGRAFRNSEPNSSWHLPEFTMLEFYKVGVSYLELADEVLKMLQYIVKKLNCHPELVSGSINGMPKRVRHDTSIIVYQGKKISFERWEKSTVVQVFAEYAKINETELFNQKLFFKKAIEKKYKTYGFSYEDLFSQIFAQEIEPHLGKNGYPTLLYDYPKELASLAKMNKNGKTAQRCEFYIDGLEVGGFCTELNDYKEQEKRFLHESMLRKKKGLINHVIDKDFIKALKYGLVDCTGAGIGFERLAMIFANVTSIEQLKLINIG